MTIQAATPLRPPRGGGGRIDQFFVTHCHKSESKQGQAGWSVRAASTDDEGLLVFAQKLLPFKLPLDMTGGGFRHEDLPRRLALVPAPEGRVALVHSAPLLRPDTVGRPGNFFSHILVLDSLSPVEALQAWGAPDWVLDYPDGAPQELSPLQTVPRGEVLGDGAMRAFLNGKPAPAGAEGGVATVPWPEDRLAEVGDRRTLFRAVLAAWLILLERPAPTTVAPGGMSGAGGIARSRLFVQAEPGLVALLLFGVARLLPENWVKDLWFSTFEVQAALREPSLAQAIGTYSHNKMRGLEADYLGRRGYGVDTFLGVVSPELTDRSSQALDLLIDLAAADGSDRLIDRLHDYCRLSSRRGMVALDQAARLFRAERRVRAKQHDLNDLMALQDNELGRSVLADPEVQRLALPVLRPYRHDRSIVDRFRDLFRHPDHLAEFRSQARTALRSPTLDDWRKELDALRWYHPTPAEQGRALDGLIAELTDTGEGPRLSPTARRSILEERSRVEPSWPTVPEASGWLLDVTSPEEVLVLRRSIPAAWFEQAMHRWVRGRDVGIVLSALDAADDDEFQALVLAMKDFKSPETVVELMAHEPDRAPDRFGRFISLRLKFKPEYIEWALLALQADQPAWDRYWNEPDTLGRVMGMLGPEHQTCRRIWARQAQGLNNQCLAPASPEAARLRRLVAARKALGDRVPEGPALTIDRWQRLVEQLHDPPPWADPDELATLIRDLGYQSRRGLLRGTFDHYIASHNGQIPPDRVAKLARSVRGFYATEAEAAAVWAELIRQVLRQDRLTEYEIAYFKEVSLPESRRNLAAEVGHLLTPETLSFLRRPVQAGAMAPAAGSASRPPAVSVATVTTSRPVSPVQNVAYSNTPQPRRQVIAPVTDPAVGGSPSGRYKMLLGVAVGLCFILAISTAYFARLSIGGAQNRAERELAGDDQDAAAPPKDRDRQHPSQKSPRGAGELAASERTVEDLRRQIADQESRYRELERKYGELREENRRLSEARMKPDRAGDELPAAGGPRPDAAGTATVEGEGPAEFPAQPIVGGNASEPTAESPPSGDLAQAPIPPPVPGILSKPMHRIATPAPFGLDGVVGLDGQPRLVWIGEAGASFVDVGWEGQSLSQVRPIEVQSKPTLMAKNVEGKLLYLGDNKSFSIVETEGQSPRVRPPLGLGELGWLVGISQVTRSEFPATAFIPERQDQLARSGQLYDPNPRGASQRMPWAYVAPREPGRGVVALAYKGREWLIVGHADGRIRSWKFGEGNAPPRDSTAGQAMAGATINATGDRLVTYAPDRVQIWRVTDLIGGGEGPARPIEQVQPSPDASRFRTAAMDRGGGLIVGAEDGKLLIWEPGVTGDPVQQIQAGAGPVKAIAFSPGGGLLVSASGDEIQVWAWRPPWIRGGG